jgi:hypothetical protein
MATVHDYASLSQAVQDWLKRPDMSSYIDYFIQSAEDRIYDDIFARNQGRGVQAIEASIPALETISATGTVPLSDLSGYIALKEMRCSTGGNTWILQRTTTEFIFSQFPNRQGTDTPQYVARDAQNFIFGPMPDSTYAVSGVFWARSAALAAGNTTTWMTSTIPATLLAACNAAAALFLKDNDAASLWDSMYVRQLDAFLARDKMEELSGSGLMTISA